MKQPRLQQGVFVEKKKIGIKGIVSGKEGILVKEFDEIEFERKLEKGEI